MDTQHHPRSQQLDAHRGEDAKIDDDDEWTPEDQAAGAIMERGEVRPRVEYREATVGVEIGPFPGELEHETTIDGRPVSPVEALRRIRAKLGTRTEGAGNA